MTELMSGDSAFVESARCWTAFLIWMLCVILPPLHTGEKSSPSAAIMPSMRVNSTTKSRAEPLVFAVMPSAVIGDGDVIEWEA